MARIEFKNDVTRAQEEMEGSDGRANVSSRSDGRRYYTSRDQAQAYAMTFEHSSAADGEYTMYLKNTSPTRRLVISDVGIYASNVARMKLWFVTGTATGGVARTPHNLNKASSNAAEVTAISDQGGTAIAGLTTHGDHVDDIRVGVDGHISFRLQDSLHLGQNDAIAIEMDTGTSTPLIHGACFFIME